MININNCNKKRILIADDEHNLTQSMAFTLKCNGYDTEIVENGLDAYNKITHANQNNNPYDIIITDLNMPMISGFELISKIREIKIKTPILVISGFLNTDAIKELKRIGSKRFLDKPFTKKAFLSSITNILNSNKII